MTLSTPRALAIAALLGAAATTSAPASAACFFVYGAKNELLYRSTTPPIDLSKPISQAVRARFASGHLTMIPDESGCPDLQRYGPGDLLQAGAPGSSNTSPIEASPLFRNIESRTAIGNDSSVPTPKSSTSGAVPRR